MKRIIEKLSLLTLKDIILSVVISLILVSIGTTFAYFSWQSTNNPLVNITVEDMADVKFGGGNDLKATDIGPVLDYNDGEIIDFSVRKKIDAPIYALIQVTPKILPNEFKVSYFKGKLLSSTDNATWSELTEFDFTDKDVDNVYLVYEGEINDKLTYYKMIFYIDGTVYNSNNLQDKTFEVVIDVAISGNKCDAVTKNEDNSITYAGKKWYQIAEDDTSTTLVLAENYGTGSYGPYTTINSSYWANSTVKTKVNEFLTDSSIDTECLINDETYGYVRVPYKSELSTNIPNDSATSFWTMDNIDNSYVVVGKADGTLYEGWNRVNTTPVTTVGLINGNYSGGPHGSVSGGQSYLWDRTATISREWGALKFNPFGSASNYDQESTVYYATGGGVEKTVEDVIDCLDSTKSYYSYSWYTSSFSNNVDRETASVCTEVGKKTVYLCHEVACCKYGSKNSSVNGGSTSYSYKDFTYNTFSSCNSTTEYKATNISETIGYRPVIKVKK